MEGNQSLINANTLMVFLGKRDLKCLAWIPILVTLLILEKHSVIELPEFSQSEMKSRIHWCYLSATDFMQS